MFGLIQLLLVIFLIGTREEVRSVSGSRNTRATDERFRILLNLYQMNPLKQSNVYRAFSNRMLITHKGNPLNLDSNESTREKEKSAAVKLKLIDKAIHASIGKDTQLEQGEFNPSDTNAESFDEEHYVLKRKPSSYSLESKDFNPEKEDGTDFDKLLAHIESNEFTTREPVIKTTVKKMPAILKTYYNSSMNVIRLGNISRAPLVVNFDHFNEIGNFSDEGVLFVR